MAKYRKKPVVIEAFQYNGTNGYNIGIWSKNNVIESPVLEPAEDNPKGSYLQIETLEGVMTAIVGDWIIKGIKGEFYPCKPDIFEATYEKVKEELTPIPQPACVKEGDKQLGIGDEFDVLEVGHETFTKRYKIVGCREPVDGNKYIHENGGVIMSFENHGKHPYPANYIRFIVESVPADPEVFERDVGKPELIDGFWYYGKRSGDSYTVEEIYKHGYFPSKYSYTRPATLANLAVEIDGVKCWFVEVEGTICVKYEDPDCRYDGFTWGNTGFICKEQWDALMEGNK